MFMAGLPMDFTHYFQQLYSTVRASGYRLGIYFQEESSWSRTAIQQGLSQFEDLTIFQIGGEPLCSALTVAYNKGHSLLGQECNVLICDLSEGWDANSFSAGLGTLVGGGLLLILGHDHLATTLDKRWLSRAFAELLVIKNGILPPIPDWQHPAPQQDFSQQASAVDNIMRVVEGHRKRPLILTADRGRGKSSALGMAAAQLMQSRDLSIIVTAPSLAAVAPIFDFAQRLLPMAQQTKGQIRYQGSQLRYLAPDEIQRNRPECDVLFIDEAAALPLPFLHQFVEHYHRTVFSTTIHGYEGCGRGFTLKFHHWLKQTRPEMRSQHLDQPIRWALHDPLEAWHLRTFLLDYELTACPSEINLAEIVYHDISKMALFASPSTLRVIFTLLVNAHYQTSPNDLFHLLADNQVKLFVARYQQQFVGCILAVQEGQLTAPLIEQIQLGQRRPKGHLAPITLANQLGITQAAQHSCWRIMRIAVHPDLQLRGVGSQLLQNFMACNPCDYFASSFGCTAELVSFWVRNQFQPVKIGSQRDQTSGCYSLLVVYSQQAEWVEAALKRFLPHLVYELKDSLQDLDSQVIRALLTEVPLSGEVNQSTLPLELLTHYSLGGANYESVAVWIERLLLFVANTHYLPDLLLEKVLQQHSWQRCAIRHGYTGRKQLELALRQQVNQLLMNLQCKLEG